MSTLLCARAASAHVPALRRAQLPAEVQRKTLRPLGANTPAAVRAPRSAGAEKGCRPERANTPAAVRAPRSVGAEKGCRPERVNRLRGSGPPITLCRENEKRHRSRGASPLCEYVGRSAAAVAAITAAAAGIITTGTAGTAAAAALTAAYPDQDDQDNDPPPGIFAPEAVRRTHTVISSYQRFHYILW